MKGFYKDSSGTLMYTDGERYQLSNSYGTSRLHAGITAAFTTPVAPDRPQYHEGIHAMYVSHFDGDFVFNAYSGIIAGHELINLPRVSACRAIYVRYTRDSQETSTGLWSAET